MVIAKTLCARAGGLAALALLALPSLASANPGKGPELVQRSGQFVIVHADGRDGSSTRQAVLRDGLARTPVRAPADVWIEPGARVRLEGTMQNGTLVLADSVTAVKQTAPSPLQAGAPRLAASLSMHNTAVVLFGFSGGPTQGQLTTDPASATTEMFGDPLTTPDSLNSYYQEQTYGQIGFSGTVFGPYDIAGPTGTCSANDFYTWAAQAENATGMNDSAFKHWVFVFPDVPACGWSGLAEIGGPHVWINGGFEVPVIAHELGHNLGISHAGGLSCTASGVAAPMGDACTIDRTHYQLPQYADPFDAMGNWPVLRQMNMEHKQALGLLPDLRCPDGRRLGDVSARSHGDARPVGGAARVCRSPAVARTSSSTAGRPADSISSPRRSRACSCIPSRPTWSTRIRTTTAIPTPR